MNLLQYSITATICVFVSIILAGLSNFTSIWYSNILLFSGCLFAFAGAALMVFGTTKNKK
jgi:hypothetical protein